GVTPPSGRTGRRDAGPRADTPPPHHPPDRDPHGSRRVPVVAERVRPSPPLATSTRRVGHLAPSGAADPVVRPDDVDATGKRPVAPHLDQARTHRGWPVRCGWAGPTGRRGDPLAQC